MVTEREAFNILKRLCDLAYTAERYKGGYPDEEAFSKAAVNEIMNTLLNINIQQHKIID